MPAISVGSVEVDVVPNTQGIYARLQSALVPPARRVGDEVGRIIGQQIAQHITPAVTQGINNGARAAKPAATRQGSETGGAFARSLKARLEAAFRSMPKLDVRLSDTGVDADLARLRARLETLAGKTVGIDIDAERARAEAADIEERLRRIGAAHPNVAVRADTAAAIAQLRLLREQIDEVSARPAHIRVETDGTFGQRLRAAVQQAEASLPNINIGADTTPAEVEVARLRAQLTALRDVRIGVDMDVATATARIEAIQARLQALAASDADVAVRIDTGAAAGQLAAIRAQIAALDGKRINIRTDVSTAQATAALFQLTVALGAVAAIPAIPILAAGIGAIASAAVAAGAGVGALAAVAIPAFVGIAGALQAQKTAQDAAATASIKGGQAAGQGASKALQMAGAQQALATAHRNAARQIGQAEDSVADAVRSAAEANRQASQQVKAARQSLADAVQQAADRQRDAAERVAQAEDSLADAQRTARQAQQDLTQARKDAVAELAELSNRLADAQLSERDAALSVQEAQLRLRATQAVGSKATALEQQRAQLSYDQAVQRLKEQQAETKRLSNEKRAADKAGVEGSETVRNAQERLSAAERGIADQQKALGKARNEAARTQVQGQRDIAAAQEKVAESQRNVTRVQEDGARSVARAQESLVAAQQSAADSIASAQRQIASASQQAAGGVDQAAVAQAKYQAALAKLTPSARATFSAFVDLKGAFGAWSESLQPRVMPIFTRALLGLKNALPGLTPFVKAAADAIGELQDRASRGFKSEGWKEFKTDLAGATRPAIIGLGVAFANLFKGMGGIIQAFLPHMDSISTRMQAITGRFAAWGAGLKGSPAFERFLAYAAENGPLVARTIGDISSAFYQVAKALSPLSGPVLEVLGALARGLASIATTLPWLIQGMYLAYIATRLWTIAMFLFNTVMSANPLVLVGLAIVALVGFVIYAYKHFSWFRQGVQAAWSGIQTAASAAWTGFLKPVFDGISLGAQKAGRWATWLWRNGIKPAFDGISLGARILAGVIAVVLIAPMVIAFRLAGATGSWLWRVALGPAFRNIGGGAKWLYRSAIKPAFDGIGGSARWLFRGVVKPAMDGIVTSFRFVGRTGAWLYEKAIRPALRGIGSVASWLWRSSIRPTFGFISDKAKWLYSRGLKPAFDKIKSAVRLVGAAFGRAKDAIEKAFGQIKKITAEPVNFVIEWVYTKGIKAVWDKVAKFVGLDKLPDAPNLLAAGGTVGDGFGRARPMKVNRPTAIVGEGRSQYPEFVIPTDPRYRNRAQALHAAAGTKLMAAGGFLGPIGNAWDWTKDTVGDVVGKGIDWAKTGADLIAHPSKVWSKLVRPILSKVTKGVGTAPVGKAIAKFPRKMVSGLKNKIVDAVSSMFAGGGGAEWLKPVKAKYGTRFGVPGSMWSSGRHTGLDFPAATGTPIRAVSDGTVSQVASGGPYGKHVQIDHGGGLSSFYAHMSAILAKLHKHVNRGTTIGEVGATGNTTGPHLHLEARRNGSPVDPMPFLTSSGGKGLPSAAVGAAQQYAKSILHRYGWGPSQFGPLKKLWEGESNWRWDALNRSSGAYGIPQSLPASKMRSAGADYLTNYKTQIRWGLGYIKGRPDYGSPSKAYSKWLARRPHWYDQGGMLQPGLNLAYNGTGRPEPVFTQAQASALTRLALSPTAGGGGEFTGDLYLDSGVFLGHVRGEVQQTFADLTTTLRSGRR
ncbi:peptidoglycan DD-metalloendopeptidase family protein [Streptomyces luteocolor]|uniref:aggregation-promoting factor C-terminal-like domain-containing protein n=1 Tax=Streptomyces luteocolor TaxID=285500 RepID=UPI000853953E|nr:peptidoglycan DD-metalloendopeptidase family protein [Streptomyces luteocolor]